jgi:putative membrane protein
MSTPDPRIFFAAERTLLAWSRTALGVIGLGFVVARFGLFLRLVRPHPDSDTTPHLSAVLLGVALALVGATISALAAWQYARFYRTLGTADLPPGYWVRVGPVFGFGVAAAGVVLAIELVL